MKTIKSLVCTLLMYLATFTLSAQSNEQANVKSMSKGENGSINFAKFKDKAVPKPENINSFLKTFLGANSEDRFIEKISKNDNLGFTNIKLQQYYKDIPVEFSEYSVHIKNGFVESVNGQFAKLNVGSTNPVISEGQALGYAKSYFGASAYLNENPTGELVIAPANQGSGSYRLAWKFLLVSSGPIVSGVTSEAYIYVDAINGKVINEVSTMFDGNTPSTGQSRYSGTVDFIGDIYTDATRGAGVRLREVRNNVNIITLNYNGSTDFFNTNTNWSSGSWSGFVADQVAIDAHWGAEMVVDYWRLVHGRNSIDNNGLNLKSLVHNTIGDNAYWSGSTLTMNYGDGQSYFRPLTSLDVCAHEVGHGVMQFSANLTYAGESGALNEGFSDIWGAAIEAWAAPNKSRWDIGEEITLTKPALRSMSNPLLYSQPKEYKGTNWRATSPVTKNNDYGGVHTNSGVMNYWFYLISEGGSGSNSAGNSFNVSAIGIDDAARIAYRAQSVYLTASSQYIDARNATIQSAADLFGANSAQVIAVTNAWYAVKIGNAYTQPTAAASETPTFYISAEPSNPNSCYQVGGLYSFRANQSNQKDLSTNTYNWGWKNLNNNSSSGEPISDNFEYSFNPETPGTYEIWLQPNENVSFEKVIKTISVVNSCPSANTQNKNELKAYPNPTIGVFKLEIPTTYRQKGIVQIYSQSGLLVFSRNITSGLLIMDIDASFFESGVYHIKIESGSNKLEGDIIKE